MCSVLCVLCALCFACCAVCSVLCALCFVRCAVYTVFCAPCLGRCALCAVVGMLLCVLCFACCTLCVLSSLSCQTSSSTRYVLAKPTLMSQQNPNYEVTDQIQITNLQSAVHLSLSCALKHTGASHAKLNGMHMRFAELVCIKPWSLCLELISPLASSVSPFLHDSLLDPGTSLSPPIHFF